MTHSFKFKLQTYAYLQSRCNADGKYSNSGASGSVQSVQSCCKKRKKSKCGYTVNRFDFLSMLLGGILYQCFDPRLAQAPQQWHKSNLYVARIFYYEGLPLCNIRLLVSMLKCGWSWQAGVIFETVATYRSLLNCCEICSTWPPAGDQNKCIRGWSIRDG